MVRYVDSPSMINLKTRAILANIAKMVDPQPCIQRPFVAPDIMNGGRYDTESFIIIALDEERGEEER
jgi:hypothetical protein